MSEREFITHAKAGPNDPAFAELVIDALRKGREKHPMVDAGASIVPFVGAGQTALDVSQPGASNSTKAMALLGMIPGERLLRALRGVTKEAKIVDRSPLEEVLHAQKQPPQPDIPFPKRLSRKQDFLDP